MPFTLDDLKKITATPATPAAPATRQMTPPPGAKPDVKQDEQPKPQFKLDQLREITGDINPVRKAKEYLFGKPDMPTTPGQQYVEAKDSGVIGNLWNKFMTLPTGTGKTVGHVEESIFNPLGRTNLQQERAQTNEETRYKEATEGRGVAAKAAASALSGVGGLIEGQTSPFNMALLFAGPVKAAAATAEMASEAPSILGKLAHFGFASQMAIGAVDEGQASADAFMKGDYESGIKLAVGGLTSALMAREGVTDMVAQERVNRDLDGNAQSFYKKPWKKLTPQEQVSVVYQVAKADAPLIADLQRMQDGADSLSPEQQKALQEKANQFLETQGRIRRKGFTPPPSEGASEIHQGLETRQQEAEERPAQNAAIVAEAYKQRTAAMDQRQAALDAEKSEKDRIQNLRTVETDYLKDKKEKAEVDDFFGTLQAQSPAEREALAFDKKVGDAWGDLYAEQNRQRAVKDSEEAEAAKRAADQGPTGLQIVDKRAMGAQAQVILDEIEQSRLPEKSANPYLDLNERVNNLADALEPGRNSETVWENLRRRQRDGEKLSDQERDFVRTYARRRMAEIQLAKGNKVLGERLADQQRELDANIFAATERAERLSDAADSLHKAAERGGDVESADKAAKAAIEAHRLAEEAITERQQEQARRHAMRTGGLIVEKGPAVPVVAGRPVQIYLPDGRSLPARYGAVRLSQLIASHDPFSFEPNPNYKPERMQPRRLESDKINQARITLDSAPENYRGNLFTSDDPTSQQGPPVILEDGRVAGGNSRLLRLKRALETPSRDAIIKNLHDQFEKFGIGTPDLIDRDDPYIPVRILDETPENYEALVELGDILNRDHMMGMSSSETSVLAADKLTNEDVDQIGLWMEAMPEGSTLRSVLAARGQDFLEMMIKRGVILESKRASFMTDNVLNEEGKSLFERMILGRVINDPKLIDTVPKELLFKVERALPSWFRLMSAAPEWDITDRLKDALKLWKKIEAVRPELQDIGKASDSMVDKYLNPTEFKGGVGMLSFGGEEEIRPRPHPAVLGLAKLLEENSLGNKRAMEKYADESHGIQTRLLGNSLTPVEAFNEFIVGMKGEQVKPEEWLTLKAVSDEASEVIESMSRKESTETEKTERAAEAKNPNQMAPPPLNTKSKRKLSPPPSDMVTLYRAEKIPGSGRPIPDWVKDDPKFQKSAVAEGRWFTSELSEAQEYLKEAGFGGDPARIVTVEIPKSDLDKHRAANNPEAAKFVHSTKRDALNDEFFLPRELAEKASLYKPKPPVAAVEKKINALPDVGKVTGLAIEGKSTYVFRSLGGEDLYSAEDTERAISKAKEISDQSAKKYESASLAARKDRTAENLKAAEDALFSYKIRLGDIHMMESHLEWIKRQPEGAFLPAPKTPMAGEVVEIPDFEAAREKVDLGVLSSGKITKTMEFGNRRYVPVQTTNGEVHLAPLFTPEEWGNRVVTGNVNPERGHQGNPITFKGKKYILGGKESQLILRAKPDLPTATDRVASAAMNGVVTSQSLRDFFEADPRTEKYAEPLIRVLTEVMPRATGKTLPEFLRDHLQDVRFGREADFLAGRESLAQRDPAEVRESQEITRRVYAKSVELQKEAQRLLEKHDIGIRAIIAEENDTFPDEVNNAIRAYLTERKRAFEERKQYRRSQEQTTPEKTTSGTVEYKGTSRDLGPLEKGGTVKGVAEFLDDQRSLITLFEHADPATVLHEFFHAMRPNLLPEYQATLESFAGVKNGIWDREAEEKVARAWEKYHYDGKAPTPGLKAVFDQLKDVFRQIYSIIKGSPIDVKLTKEVRDTFDGWYGKQEDLSPAKKVAKVKDLRTGLKEVSSELENAEGTIGDIDDHLKKSARGDINTRHLDGLNRIGGAEITEGIPVDEQIRDGRYHPEIVTRLEEQKRLMKSEIEGLRSAETTMKDQLKSLGGDRQLTPPPAREMAPPPSAETVTSSDRAASTKKAVMGAIQDRLAEARTKVFETQWDAIQWVQQHAKDLHGAEVWQRPQGDLFVEFVPKKPEMLFQQEGLADQIRRLERLKRAEQEERDPLKRAEMKREILRLNGKLGMGQEGLLSFTPKPKEEGIIRPFSSTPEAKKEDVILIASPTEEESRGNARGTNADEAARVQDPEGSRELHGRASESGPGHADGESGRGSTGRGLGSIEPIRIAPPKRVAAQPGLRIASPEQWAVRTRDLNMPDGLPVPSIRLSDNIAVMLMFPGQREIVETALTALDQYDGAVIASPPGSGKTYLSLAVTRHFVDDGAKKILILTKNEDVIESRKGFRKVGKNTFGINIERLPSDVKNLKDGVYITTHATMRTRNLAAQSSWDLVIADESAEGRNWQVSGQGKALKSLNGVAKKMLYVSATPFHTAVETGYMDKLGLWRDSDFPTWSRQFGVYQDNEKMLRGGNDPKKLIKLRQQLIERGQFVTQEMNYDGFKADFAKVPLTEEHQQGIRNIDEAFSLAERYFRQRPNGEKMIAAVRGNSVMYMKNYLERIRLPQVVEMMREAKRQGWQVGVFSEHSAGKEDIDQYLQEADRAMGGKISQLLPKLEGVYDSLKNAFGDDVVNYSGSNDTTRRGENNEWVGGASRDKDLFMDGRKSFMFSTYAKGGVGVSMHDDAGNRPRMAIYLGPPWSGIMLDQALGRFWRYGTRSNVHSVFMVSDAAPEVDMIVNKIAPRMESLRAAINGVDGTDPLVKRMRSLSSNQNELDAYTLGQKVKANTEDFLAVRRDIPISNWKSVQILDAAQAKNKGMRYPGMVQDQPGIILLQADFGKPQSQPPRFLSVEDAKARLLVSDMAGSVAEGEDMPGADGELEDLEPGERMKIANDVGVQATISAEDNSEGNPSAAVRTEFETNMIALKRAKNSVEATPGGPDDPVWKVTSEPPEGGWGRKIKDNDKTIFTADMVASADNSILSIGRQIGSPDIAWDIVRMKRGYFATMANHGGDWSTEFMKAVKGLTDEEFSTAWLVKEGNMASPSSRISEAVEAITKLTDRIGDQLETAKIQVTERDADGRPVMRDFRKRQNYMPHIFNYNEKITVVDPKLGTSEEFTLGELLGGTLPELKRERIMNGLEAKTGWDRSKIEDWISRKSKERRTKIAGNVERSREEDLPFYRTDAHAFFQYIEQTAEALSRTEVFGQSRQNLDGLIAQLPNQKARSMVNTYFEPLFKPTNFGKLWSKVYGSVTSFEIATKMTFSPVKVPFHMVHMTLAAENVGSLAKGIFAGITNYKELRERAVFSGALSRRMAAENLFESGNPIKAGHAMLGAIGFNKLYEFDRVVGNFIGENYMEQKALPEMMRKGKNADRYRRVLVDTMLIHPDTIDAAVARGRWTKEDLARAGAAFTNRTMFTDDPMEMPSWARSQTDNHAVQNLLNLLRTAYSMKTFMLKTGNLLKEQVIDQARKGNYRPLMYFATLYPTVGGESLRFFGSLIHGVFGAASQVAKGVVGAPVSGQETSQWDKYERELSELFTDPSVGKTAHRLLDNAALATGWDLITHFVDPIIFPPASKKARASARKYMWDDLEDNLRGPIWTDLINAGKYGAKVAATVTDNEKGEGEKLYEETAKWLVDTVPAARPYVPQNFKKKYSMAPPPR